MIAIAYYLLKVILVSGLLYSYYLIALRNKKFHQYNRFYLILTVLLSLILPLIKIASWTTTEGKVVKMLSAINYNYVEVKAAGNDHFLSNYNQLALYSFLVITGTGLLIVLLQLAKTISLVRDNPKQAWNNVYFVFLKNSSSPFSFFKYIFWDKSIDPQSEEGKLILQHELVHVKHLHSLDKLLMNLILAGGWANPFFWIIRKELNMLHEFIADKNTISNGDTNAFATMLLTASYPQHAFVLTNSFFHSPIKRRLIMITTKNPSFSYLRRLTALPLIAIICIVLAFKAEKKKNNQIAANKEKSEIKSSEIENTADTVEAKFPGGNDAWRKYLETNLNANVPVVKDKAPKGIYTVKVQFVVTENGEIKDVSATKTPDKCPSCATEAVRIIKSGPNWEPMTIDGKKVTSQPIQFISFMVQ